MLMKSGNPLTAFREYVAKWNREPPREVSADEQTRLSWARLAESIEDVPEAYRSFFDALAPEHREPFPYTVITPTFRGFQTPQTEKLVCRIGDDIHVLEKSNGRPAPVCFPLKDILRIETGTILLQSWLIIDGMDAGGRYASTTLRFNTVTEPLLAPFVEGFRSAAAGPAAGDGAAADLAAFDSLETLHFKFKSFGRKTVRAGEKVVQMILQPELRRNFFHIAGFTLSRQIAPTHMIILTDRELILIREDESRNWGKENRYGGIWNYVPLRKISSVSLSRGEDGGLLILTVRLPQKVRLDVPYPSSRRAEVMKLQRRIKAEING
jgi:hypothetical protein